MKIVLQKQPKNVRIIQGFPGFGLVGAISTEYLIQHLQCEQIGAFWLEELPATVVVHQNKLVQPISIHYNKQYNLVIVHAITGVTGVEWILAEYVNMLAKQLKAKEIICLEGVGSNIDTEVPNAYYYTTLKAMDKKLSQSGVKQLSEGIIMGISAALLMKTKTPLTAIFADTHSDLPDSKAAAKVISVLDSYLGLKIDPKPLLKTAQEFEQKLQGIIEKGKQAQEQMNKTNLSYVG